MAQQTLQTFNRAIAVAKSDTVNLDQINGHGPVAIWVGGAGVVIAVYDDESTAAFTCVAGSLLPVTCKRVNSTSTTATLMVGLYQL